MAISTRPEAAELPPLLPGDAADAALLAEVHPTGWQNPVARDRYHLVVLGGGTGGLVSAAIAAGLGARVALVERALLGGDCLNVGCVPSKAVLRAARAWHDARRAAAEFGGPGVSGSGDFGAAMERMRRIRAALSPVDGAARFRSLGVDVFLGHGTFTGPDVLEVGGQRLRFRRAIVATGARAAAPPIPGLAEAGYLTNENVFTLTELPERIAVLGAGPIGCELAQAFARFGAAVTVIDVADRPLANEDPDAAAVVRRALEADGVTFLLGRTVESVERTGAGVSLAVSEAGSAGGGRPIVADHVLVATGRRPTVDGLGLEAAGVETDPDGVVVDDRLRTTSRRIYAVGDVASRQRFTHAADAHARLAVPNALFFGLGGGRVSDLLVPRCTYTDPELAHTGPTPAELDGRGIPHDTVTVPMADVDRARLDGDTAGFLRVMIDRRDRILGATLVAAHAGETISELTLAMRTGLPLRSIGATLHPYPTQAEALRKAADARNRARLTPATRRLLRGFFTLFR